MSGKTSYRMWHLGWILNCVESPGSRGDAGAGGRMEFRGRGRCLSKGQRQGAQVLWALKEIGPYREGEDENLPWDGCWVWTSRTWQDTGTHTQCFHVGMYLFFFFFHFLKLYGTRGKESTCQCRRLKRYGSDPWVRKIPWRRKWQPAPVFLPGKSHGQRSLVGYSPWGRKE